MSFHYIKMHVHDVHFQYSLDEKDKRWVNNDRILIFGWNTALTLSVRMHVHKHLPLISSVISTASLKLITTGLSLTANDGKETLMRATRFRRTLVNQLNETSSVALSRGTERLVTREQDSVVRMLGISFMTIIVY